MSETVTSQLGDSITDIVLFGSSARGDVTRESDIDLLVLIIKNADAPKIRRKVHEIAYLISLATNTLITFIVVTRQEFLRWVRSNYSFAEDVVKQGIQLCEDVLNIVRK